MDPTIRRRRSSALLYVISAALSGNAPVSKLPAESIYSLAIQHSLGAIACHGLELAGAAPEAAVSDKLQIIRRTMLCDRERAELLSRFESEKIKYINLKGVVIKDMYPELGLREMSDNDIFIRHEDRRRVKQIMREFGYKIESYGKGHHDGYVKEPIYNFEIHIALFSYKQEQWAKYFSDIMSRTLPTDGSEYNRRMTDEDFYIFMKAHEYKHYTMLGGTGLRALVDTYVFMREKLDALDMSYVERECEKLGISDYESCSRSIAMKIFDPSFSDTLLACARDGAELPLEERELQMLDYIASSGTYGNVANEVENAMRQYESNGSGAKLKFLLGKLFPPMSYYMENAPIAYKYKILIPFAWFKRLIAAILRNPVRIFSQIKKLIKYKKK